MLKASIVEAWQSSIRQQRDANKNKIKWAKMKKWNDNRCKDKQMHNINRRDELASGMFCHLRQKDSQEESAMKMLWE